ncbi:hypothetical protein MMPV_000692 [Pyropia vietnamensis]
MDVERTLRVGGRAPPRHPSPSSSPSPSSPSPGSGGTTTTSAGAGAADGHPVRHTLVLLVSAPSGAAALALPTALTRSGAVLTRVVHGAAPPGTAAAAAAAGEEEEEPAAAEPRERAPWGGCGADDTPVSPPMPGGDPDDGFDRWAYDTSI